jgi:hypothetical protein
LALLKDNAGWLVEAVTLSIAGGFVGIVLGIPASALISRLAAWATAIGPGAVLLAVFFCALVGIGFGYSLRERPPISIPAKPRGTSSSSSAGKSNTEVQPQKCPGRVGLRLRDFHQSIVSAGVDALRERCGGQRVRPDGLPALDLPTQFSPREQHSLSETGELFSALFSK